MRRIKVRKFSDVWFVWTRPCILWQKYDHACYRSKGLAFEAGENILDRHFKSRYTGETYYK